MQTLYTLATTMEPADKELQKKSGTKILDEKLSHSIDLLAISILYTFRVADYVQTDARIRASKFLPTEEDLKVNTKIADNEFMLQVLANETFNKKVKDSKLQYLINEDWVKKLYQHLVKTSEYKEYISKNERTPAEEKSIMQFVWEKLILADESLQEYFAEELQGWEDDFEMTKMLMENFFKNTTKINFLVPLSEEKYQYAHSLLYTVIDKDEYCMELIKPKIVHWDTDRIAMVDLLLLKMGLCEMLYFPTIPTKVTINEYIEVAKVYSTPQSGNFVNGVLDNILKDLTKENKIRKQERTRKS
jgi:N utilization substance protein B